MARRNIHKSKRLKNSKAAISIKPTAQPAGALQPTVSSQPLAAASPIKTAPVKPPPAQEAAAVRFAELPYELRRIALFFASVVVLLIVLWFFLK
jgi:hypothetical protein